MNRILKGFVACLIFFITLGVVGSKTYAQTYNNQSVSNWLYRIFPFSLINPNSSANRIPLSLQPGDILVDDFESGEGEDLPGWEEIEPGFQVYGFGTYAPIFKTVFDMQQENRVLDVYHPASGFLLGVPFEQPAILFDLHALPDANGDGISMALNSTISFDFKAPYSIKSREFFELDVIGKGKGEEVCIRLFPKKPLDWRGPAGSDISDGLVSAVNYAEEDDGLFVDVILGSDILDGEWQTIWVDLMDVLNEAVVAEGLDPDEWGLEKATAIRVKGQMFRLDNIIFRANSSKKVMYPPHLFKIGPRFAQIFEPYRYLFIADYRKGDDSISSVYDFLIGEDFPNMFITDPNEIARIWISEYGADQNRFGSFADPEVSAIMGRDFVIDPLLPIFANPNFRLGKNPCLEYIPGKPFNKTLDWHVTPRDSSGHEFVIAPLEIDPYDGMPTYMPVKYAMEKVFYQYHDTFFGPQECLYLECALWNAGFTHWPNVAKLDFIPEAFEDLTLTIAVSNGISSNYETFPVFVVNYAVTNHAPLIPEVENLVFYCGEKNDHFFNVIDPDCMIFSLSENPSASHKPANFEDFRADMDDIYWTFLNPFDLGCFCTANDILDHGIGLLSWVPKFEDVYSGLVLGAKDPYGAYGIAEFNLFCIRTGTCFNHPPIVLGGPTGPIVINAGEELFLHSPDFSVEDPDGDELYTSCNIGSCSRASDGLLTWRFQTLFPGLYDIEIIFYDARGGYARMEFQVDVKPWWSSE